MSTKRIFHHVFLLVFFTIVFASTGCKRNPTSPEIPQTEDGLWTIYTPYNWTHDGQPYSSAYCIVYSDEASYEMKRQIAEIADGWLPVGLGRLRLKSIGVREWLKSLD